MKFYPCILRRVLSRPILLRPRGQALSEFLVLAVALVPLFLLIPIIAKYQDISHSTQMASRYVAFEAMTRNDSLSTWKPEAQLADEVRRRFFSNADAAIKTNDKVGNFKAHQNLFWRDPNDKPLIENFDSDVSISFGAGNNTAHSGGFSGASDGTPFTLHNKLALQARGIYTANVSVALANLPDGLQFYRPFNDINLIMRRSTSVLIDGWTGRNPSTVQAKLDNAAIYPGSILRPLSNIVDPIVSVIELPGGISGPRLGQLDFWADVVPKDRLRTQ